MLVPDSLRTNPYRILRLSSDAPLSEIHKSAASLRREARLGIGETNATDVPFLGQACRTETDIRAAVGRLENPEQRLKDRLFWFHAVLPNIAAPTVVPEPVDAETAGIRHDNALRALINAIHSDLDDAGVRLWVDALRAWHQVISDDNYWTLSLAIE